MRFVGSADAFPVPVGPKPQESRPIAYAAKNTDLLLADAAERSRAAEWPWDMWCRICHIRPTSHRTEAEALEAADRHVKLQHASQAEVHKLMAAGGLSELETLRARVAELEHTVQQMVEGLNGHDCPPPNEAPLDTVTRWMGYLGAAEARVAELEAERHSTNEALDDAVRELRARPSCPCPPEGRPHQVGCPQAEVPPPLFPTVASLREASSREEPHDSPLHHPYTTPHDLDMPATGGA